jgi:hypothetical protein
MLREDKVVTISDGLSGAGPKPRKKEFPRPNMLCAIHEEHEMGPQYMKPRIDDKTK